MEGLEINDRVRKLIGYFAEGTPLKFAKDLGLNRADKVYNIVNDINGTSTAMIDLILSKFPQVNPEWLLSGSGQMLKTTAAPKPNPAKAPMIRQKVLELIIAQKKAQGLLTPEELDLLDSLED